MVQRTAAKGVEFIRRQHRAFKVNIARNLVSKFSIGLTQQYQSIYISALGAGAVELGLVSSVGGIASTLLMVPGGWLADKYGIRKVLMSGLGIMLLSFLAFGLAQSWQMGGLAMGLFTMGFSFMMVVCPMICGNTLRSEERVTGMQLCDTVTALPRLVAPVVAAYLITSFGGMNAGGIRPLFWISAVGILVALTIVYLYLFNPIEPSKKGGSILQGFGRVFKEGTMVTRWLIYTMISTVPMYLAFYIPYYAKEIKGANPYVIGLMDSAYWASSVFLALPVGILADMYGRKKMVALLTPFYCLALVLLVVAPNDLVLILAGLLNGFFMLGAITQTAIGLELVPREMLGSWNGLNSLSRGLVNIAAPIIGGLLWASLGPEYVFYFLIATQVVKLGILWTFPSSVTRG
ncbi:MAG TPA: MFS transporter [Patescibacteria group bacterium]|nr:MFS transporter [Patescibacteria group bacterium]